MQRYIIRCHRPRKQAIQHPPAGDRSARPRAYWMPAVAGMTDWGCGKSAARKTKREAIVAVGALDPGVPYESRWAPYDRIHGPGQGQFPEGSIRPRGLWLLTRNAASPDQCRG